MLSKILSASVLGIDAFMVEVESHLESQLPAFSTVGLPDSAVRESKERVNAAIKNSGFPFPQKRITINLAPADVKKEGSAFDLPIALGILAASGVVNQDFLNDYLILGELSLDGSLRPIHGALPIAISASQNHIKGIVLPAENA
ncbi:MAG: magnesium chelatase domain-containing protein, partial [bacterium]|nr:magnesium chelatase domain-containing protein [bacterium]